VADVLEFDLAVAAGGDDQLVEGGGVGQFALGPHGEFAGERLDPATGDVDILLAEGAFDVGGGELIGRELVRVEPEAHGVAALTADEDRADAGNGLDPLFGDPVHHIGEFGAREAVGGEGEPEHRLCIGLLLGDDRLVDLLGQVVTGAADAVAHVVGGLVGVAVEVELDGDARDFLGGG
jgi:hypothetical protein